MFADSPEKNAVSPETTDTHPEKGEKKSPNTTPQIASESNVVPPVSNAHAAKHKKKCWLERGKFSVEVLTLIVVFVYTFIAYHQWTEMQKATREMVAEKRAWVGPSGEFRMTGSPRFEAHRFEKLMTVMIVEFSVDLKNWGASPATSEDDTFFLFVAGNGEATLESFRLLPCKMNEQTLTNVFGHRAIFPGQQISITNKTSVGLISPEITAVSVVGCITYRDVGNQLRHTRLLWTAVLPAHLKQELAIINPYTTWVPFTKFRMVDSAVD